MAEVLTRGPGRPKGYFTLDGQKCPSVTTVTGRFKESGGLIYWANQQGLQGNTLDDARDDATGVGTIVHGLVETYIHNDYRLTGDLPGDERVVSAFDAFREWFDGSRVEIVKTEVPLVSEKHRYGGTLDAIARDRRGRLTLLDWKSANSIYADYLLQLAAYGALWNDTQEEPLTGGFHICRFSKENGDFHHHWFPSLDEELRMFLLLRQAYELDKAVKARAK